MARTPTALQAKSALAGDELYQRRGRRALPILVRQAMAGETLYYSELAEELDMPNPRNLNFVLGSVGRAVEDYGSERDLAVPKLTALVVNKATGLPGEGVVEFLDRPDEFIAAPPFVRKRVLDRVLFGVFTFPRWEEMLQAMGLEPPPSLLTPPRLVRGGGGEGSAHRELKEYVAAHPASVGVPQAAAPGAVEVLVSSGDQLDVLFTADGSEIGIEVKAHDAPDAEVERGLYQCVKYTAVLQAMQKAAGRRPTAEVRLALGSQLPRALLGLRNTLKVVVVENVGPKAGR